MSQADKRDLEIVALRQRLSRLGEAGVGGLTVIDDAPRNVSERRRKYACGCWCWTTIPRRCATSAMPWPRLATSP